MHNLVILKKFVFNKNCIHDYYHVLLEKNSIKYYIIELMLLKLLMLLRQMHQKSVLFVTIGICL